MRYHQVKALAFAVFLLLILSSLTVQAQTSQETLDQYVVKLQNNPNDNSLREKIIKYVRMMKTAPAIPAEVDELVGQAKYVFKHAKEQRDYLDAVDAYKKIVNIVPWVGDYYYNLGVAQEQAGQPQDAINNFKFYLLASPEAKDAKDVRERIGGLKYAVERAAKSSSPTEIAGKKQNSTEELLRKINGRRYTGAESQGNVGVIDVQGQVLVVGFIGQLLQGYGYAESLRAVINGHEAVYQNPNAQGFVPAKITYIISETGDRITERRQFLDGDVREYIYLWQR